MNLEFDQIFERAFLPLQEIFGHQIPPDVLKIYLKHLRNRLTGDQLARACVQLLDTFKPTAACKFPTPSHFIDLALGSGEDRAALAVSRVVAASKRVGPNASISFGDKALHRTVERFGGWEEMRDFDWKFRETNFKNVYEAELKAGDNFGPDYLEGCYEKTNRLTEHTWTRGKAPPLLISHVDGQGNEMARLPPPERDIPKAIDQNQNPSSIVENLIRKVGAA
jgi:hypothetical protein